MEVPERRISRPDRARSAYYGQSATIKDHLVTQRVANLVGIAKNVFTSLVGAPIDPRNVKRVLDRLLKNAKLPHCRIHDLRHQFASNMLACGVDLKIVSDCLGHSQLAITADTYAHVSQDLIREAMDKAAAR